MRGSWPLLGWKFFLCHPLVVCGCFVHLNVRYLAVRTFWTLFLTLAGAENWIHTWHQICLQLQIRCFCIKIRRQNLVHICQQSNTFTSACWDEIWMHLLDCQHPFARAPLETWSLLHLMNNPQSMKIKIINAYLGSGLIFASTALCEQVQFEYRGRGCRLSRDW